MKKRISFVLSLLLACGLLVSSVGCGTQSTANTLPAEPVADREVIGTTVVSDPTHEWQLYQEALEYGYTGSYLDFLKEAGVTVSDDSAAIHAALRSVVAIEAIFSYGSGTTSSLGSGVIYTLDTASGDATILTNYHVIYGKVGTNKYGLARTINLYLYGSYAFAHRAISATFLGGEMDLDLAVLRVRGEELLKATKDTPVYAAEVPLGDSEAIAAGDKAYAIGDANGEGISVTGGVVSVPYEMIEILRADDKKYINIPEIRTDAAVNHGNSGGGLFNQEGELIGIVNARSEEETFLGYAIPMAEAIPLAESVLAAARLSGRTTWRSE